MEVYSVIDRKCTLNAHISKKNNTFLQINVYDISILHEKCISIIIYNLSENCKIKSLKKKKKKSASTKQKRPNEKCVYMLNIWNTHCPPPLPSLLNPPPSSHFADLFNHGTVRWRYCYSKGRVTLAHSVINTRERIKDITLETNTENHFHW